MPVNKIIFACKLDVLHLNMAMPKGNPNPVRTPEFQAKQFKRSDRTTEPLADKILAVRVPIEIDARIRDLPDKTAWLRRVIVEAAERELMGNDEQQ
jgi:hypothetical protein